MTHYDCYYGHSVKEVFEFTDILFLRFRKCHFFVTKNDTNLLLIRFKYFLKVVLTVLILSPFFKYW